jgi:hypothetical protein
MNPLTRYILLRAKENIIILIIEKTIINKEYHNEIYKNLLLTDNFKAFEYFLEKYKININDKNIMSFIISIYNKNMKAFNYVYNNKKFINDDFIKYTNNSFQVRMGILSYDFLNCIKS